MLKKVIRLKKLHITLIELLIVISILAIVTGVVGINIRQAVNEQKFNAEVSQVVDALRLAQNLMVIMDRSVHVKFAPEPEEGAIKMWLETNEPVKWLTQLHPKPTLLKAIQYVGFEGKSAKEKLDLSFMSKGSVMSSGILRLSAAENALKEGVLNQYICLEGYPGPIESSIKMPSKKCGEGLSPEFDKKLTDFTFQEIRKEPLPDEAENGEETTK